MPQTTYPRDQEDDGEEDELPKIQGDSHPELIHVPVAVVPPAVGRRRLPCGLK
jgi:hypothetical protein